MENLSFRERMILRCNSRRSFGPHLPSTKISDGVSDIDFSDVFGGPPRCSMADTRHSLGETFPTRKEEGLLSHSSPWAALGAKPVFGEESPSRRHLGQNFFDDIFKGEAPLSSTSRNSEVNLNPASVPSSCVLSPVHNSLPNRPEPLLVQSTLSRQFSLSKLARKIDFPASDTPSSSSSPSRNKNGKISASRWPSSLNMSPSQVVPGHEESENDLRQPYRQSPLSNQISLSSDGSSEVVEGVGQGRGGQLIKDQVIPDVCKENNQFHFSIYKWASKGIPLTAVFRGGKRRNSNLAARENGIVSGSAEPTVKRDQLSSLNEIVSVNGSSKEQSDRQGSGSSKDANVNKEAIPSKPVVETLYNLLSKDDEELADAGKSCPSKLGASHKLNHGNSVEPGKSKTAQQAKEKGGNLESTRVAAMDDDTVKLKKELGKKNVHSNENATKLPLQDATVVTEAVIGKHVKGKVQEFVKIFSQEASPKPAKSRDSQTRKFKRKSFGGTNLEDGKTNKSMADNDVRVNQNMKHPEESLFANKSTIFSSSEQFSNKSLADNDVRVNQALQQPNESLFANEEPIPETFDTAVDYIEVGNITEDQLEQSVVNHHQEEIQILDGKIQKWSNGKEGNIRSLLSTLQYVLWPDSGWKPVPLVDIIEGAYVKRAYQKALLCLHPDKLQQKGASPQQKYTAEKVFDILQEAWTHFNMLSTL